MAAFDRLKEAVRPANTIEAVQLPELQRRAADLHGASPNAPAEGPQASARKAANDFKAPAYTTEPEAIGKAYYVENRGSERRYFDDYQRKALAIRADDTTINSKREDLTTIRNMLTIAEARGWSEVKVSGSAEFKRETWIEASARGITAQGYKANDLDRQEADRRRAERGPDQARPTLPDGTNEVRRVAPASQTAAPPPFQPAVDPSQAPARLAPVRENWNAAIERFNAERFALNEARFSIVTLAAAIKSRDTEPQGQQALATSFVNTGVIKSSNALENVWKQPELAASLSAQSLTLKGLQANLATGRLDGITTALDMTEKDLNKRQKTFADAVLPKTQADPNREADQLLKSTFPPVKSEAPAVTAAELSLPLTVKSAPDVSAKPVAPVQQQAKAEKIIHTEAAPSVDHRKALQIATAALSPDGRLMLGALSEKIDRQMNKLNSEAKAEMKAYVATELVKKEKAEGPVVLSADLKRAATAPEPSPQVKSVAQPQQPTARRDEPEEPRRTRGR